MEARRNGRPGAEAPQMRIAPALCVTVLLAVPGAAAEIPATVEAGRIPGYRLVRPGVAAAGQPTPAALAELKAMGFGAVVNLRTAKEVDLAAERGVVEGQGLQYVSVPISPDSFRVEDALAVQAVLDDPWTGPVLLHCASANRVGAVIAVLQARKGKPLEEALAEGRAAGLSSATLENAVRRVLGAPLLPTPAPAAAAPAPRP
jgi:uncharacterized protein (TIGR01244 family)